MRADMIAPCGMNCSLCVNYQMQKYDLKKQGFNRKYCPGCIPRGKNCLHMAEHCELLKNGEIRFCFECSQFPCKRLKNLDKRYRTKYRMSMIKNLEEIREEGLTAFLEAEANKWNCPNCGEPVSCHIGLCLNCDLDIWKNNKKYCWDKEALKMDTKLRRWRVEDAPELARIINNKEVQDNLRNGIPFPYTTEDAENYIHMMLNTDKDQTYSFAVINNRDQLIGSIGAFRKENIHYRTAELGYYIAEPYWAKGHGTRAVKKICDEIFETTDIIRIFAEPFTRNIASCRVLEKSGFQLEGVMRKNAVKNGLIEDMSLYAKIQE